MSAPRSARRLGIIGGVGPGATAMLYSRIALGVQARTMMYPAMIVDSLSFHSDLEEPFIAGDGGGVASATFEQLLSSSVARLSAAGADCITIPCNTLYPLVAPIARSHGRRFIHPIHATLARAAVCGYHRGGVLATSSTCSFDLYGRVGADFGIDVVYPCSIVQHQVVRAISAMMRGGDVAAAANLIAEAGRKFADVEFLILGCTDLSMLAHRIDVDVPLLDSLSCLADDCVAYLTEDYDDQTV